MTKLRKRHYELQTVEVKPNSTLQGHTFLMTRIPTKLWIRIRMAMEGGPEIAEWEVIQATLDAVVDSTLDVDVALLTPYQIETLSEAWQATWKEAALPPQTGRRSPRRSPEQP